MAYQSIGLGSAADDGTGDSLRAGGTKVNANFSEIYTLLGTGTALVSSITADADDVTFVGDSYNAVWDKSASALAFADSAKATFGTGNDLSIYHSGSHSDIVDSGTGNLRLLGSQIDIASEAADETMASFVDDGAVTLYYDNSAKFATSTSGISITGTIVSSGNIELGASATLIFEGATADAYETVLTVVDPTADRTITLPNSTGTLITTGDTGVITATMIADGTITTNDIANGAVTSAKIADATIVAADLATDSITTAKITAANVTTAKIADNAITGAKIAGGSIVSAHIAADTIAESNMADDSVGSVQLKTLSTLLIKNSSGSTLKTCHCAGA